MNEKQKREDLINRILDDHPEMRRTERTIFVLLLVYAVIRVAPAVLQTVNVALTGGRKSDCLMDYVLIMLCCLFAVMVAQGVRFFALLGAVCGGYSVVFLWLDTVLGPEKEAFTAMYSAYAVVLVAVSVAQVGIMMYILLSKRCTEYLTLLDSVSKDYFDSTGIGGK